VHAEYGFQTAKFVVLLIVSIVSIVNPTLTLTTFLQIGHAAIHLQQQHPTYPPPSQLLLESYLPHQHENNILKGEVHVKFLHCDCFQLKVFVIPFVSH
jgi:hypothetical protein